MPLYEYYCEKCGLDFDDMRPMSERLHARCVCGELAAQTFRTPVRTDVYGHEVVDHVNGITYTSASEREAKMRANGGWEPAGDAKGGARNTSYQNLGKSFSYAGQGSRADNPLRERESWRPQ